MPKPSAKMSTMTRWVYLASLVSCLACDQATSHGPVSQPPRSAAVVAKSPAQQLEDAESALRQSRYAEAARAFESLLNSSFRERALLGLAECRLLTGDYQAALKAVEPLVKKPSKVMVPARVLEARAWRQTGDLEAAKRALAPVQSEPKARSARLLLGEILLEQGQRDAAEPVLMTLIEDYNADRITETDGPLLALVGRAAHLLRAPRDANDAFNLAEQAQKGHLPTLLWRAELFLEKHDPGHAEEVTREALALAPHHPDALVWLAEVRLVQAFDFDEAERLARLALEVNPKHARAHAVLAGVALRDMELELADQRIKAGLEGRPGDLELLSLAAAVRFLADDAAGFERATQAVLDKNPTYSRVYQIVGEYAEWEHRYEEIVRLMEEAVRLDPGDANAHGRLGLNLIRAGDDDAGIVSLRTAFELDPFNVRVFNTLNLYEKAIPADYVSVERGRFKIRYPKAEQALLDRYVPELLERAYAVMVKHYGFEPQAPIGIELYSTREHFSVRTSGLPRTAIQGVCFGRTLASMSLAEEKFNLGMTLWHELAHVFHIQLSKYHVPRWFTEGLAEYETLIARAEWSREHDPDLFEALRSKRIPEVSAMSRAFTRAEQMQDVATAYYASSKILTMLVENHGMDAMRRMLQAWGSGTPTEAVVQSVLGLSGRELDGRFRAHTRRQLARYEQQFVPPLRAESSERVKVARAEAPDDPKVLLRVALDEYHAGRLEPAQAALERVLEREPNAPDALHLAGRLALEGKKAAEAAGYAKRLVSQGHDGYWTQLLLAEALTAQEDRSGARAALEAAHRFDPTQAEPLTVLHRLAYAAGDEKAETAVLEKLALLEQHNGSLFARLFELYLAQGRHADVVALAEAALWADLSSFDIHFRLATALERSGDAKRARFELESAVLCEAEPERKVEGHLALIRSYQRAGQQRKAREHADRVRELDPKNSELERLGL